MIGNMVGRALKRTSSMGNIKKLGKKLPGGAPKMKTGNALSFSGNKATSATSAAKAGTSMAKNNIAGTM